MNIPIDKQAHGLAGYAIGLTFGLITFVLSMGAMLGKTAAETFDLIKAASSLEARTNHDDSREGGRDGNMASPRPNGV